MFDQLMDLTERLPLWLLAVVFVLATSVAGALYALALVSA